VTVILMGPVSEHYSILTGIANRFQMQIATMGIDSTGLPTGSGC